MQYISALLSVDFLDRPAWMWAGFLALVFIILILDLGIFNRKDHEINIRESLLMSAFYMSLGVFFGLWVWSESGTDRGVEYFTGFLIEKTLSLDNIFVIAMIFSYFKIPRIYQHRVLFWGILGVLIMRGVAIGFGAVLVHQFEWILYIFGGFLIITGIKMMAFDNEDMDVANNPVLRFMTKHFRTTSAIDGHNLFVKKPDKSGKLKLFMTPLFLSLVLIEIADLIFAVDSIPAIFGITTDAYIIYTSNIFAVLGLRALYFALAAMLSRFAYLKYALSVILVFIGAKIFINDFLPSWKISPPLSLAVTVTLLTGGVVFSLWKTASDKAKTSG